MPLIVKRSGQPKLVIAVEVYVLEDMIGTIRLFAKKRKRYWYKREGQAEGKPEGRQLWPSACSVYGRATM